MLALYLSTVLVEGGEPVPNPLLAEFRIRYPAFVSVSDDIVTYWLKDAETTVTDSWLAGDVSPARFALAAHNLAMSGYGTTGGAVGNLAALAKFLVRSALGSAEANANRLRLVPSPQPDGAEQPASLKKSVEIKKTLFDMRAQFALVAEKPR